MIRVGAVHSGDVKNPPKQFDGISRGGEIARSTCATPGATAYPACAEEEFAVADVPSGLLPPEALSLEVVGWSGTDSACAE